MRFKYVLLTAASAFASLVSYADLSANRIIGDPPRPVPEGGTGAAIAFLGVAAAIVIGRRMMKRK